jgi:hypothetical protein
LTLGSANLAASFHHVLNQAILQIIRFGFGLLVFIAIAIPNFFPNASGVQISIPNLKSIGNIAKYNGV